MTTCRWRFTRRVWWEVADVLVTGIGFTSNTTFVVFMADVNGQRLPKDQTGRIAVLVKDAISVHATVGSTGVASAADLRFIDRAVSICYPASISVSIFYPNAVVSTGNVLVKPIVMADANVVVDDAGPIATFGGPGKRFPIPASAKAKDYDLVSVAITVVAVLACPSADPVDGDAKRPQTTITSTF